MYSCFYESKKFLGCLMSREEKKTEDGENVLFKPLANFFFNIKKLFMADLLTNGLHEKIMICYIIMLYY